MEAGSGDPTTMNRTQAGAAMCTDILALWKNADRGIPILKQAKAEYAHLE